MRQIKPGEKSIRLEDGSATFILDESAGSDLSLEVGAGAQVFYLSIFRAGNVALEFRRSIILNQESRVQSACLWLQSNAASLVWSSRLDSGASCSSRALYVLSGQQAAAITERHELRGEHSQGRFFSAGLLQGQSRLEQSAEVVVAPTAQNSDSRIDSQLILLSDQARGAMRPALKISADQVKAGHGASTLLLGTEDKFYLRSRGLDEAAIRRLRILSAASAFVQDIPDEAVAKRLLADIIKLI